MKYDLLKQIWRTNNIKEQICWRIILVANGKKVNWKYIFNLKSFLSWIL